MSLYVVVTAEFCFETQHENIELELVTESPLAGQLFLDVSFLVEEKSPPQYDGVVLRADRKRFEFVKEEDVDFESHWPGEDDAYWSWDDLRDEM